MHQCRSVNQIIGQIICHEGIIGSRSMKENPVNSRRCNDNRIGSVRIFIDDEVFFCPMLFHHGQHHLAQGIFSNLSCQADISSHLMKGKTCI